jgi:hypothetical protein
MNSRRTGCVSGSSGPAITNVTVNWLMISADRFANSEISRCGAPPRSVPARCFRGFFAGLGTQLEPHQHVIVSYVMVIELHTRKEEEMSTTASRGAASLLLIGVTLAESTLAASNTCDAFGRIYRDGESFTLSTGEYGYPITYICTRGTWKEYDGTLCQLRPGGRCMLG